MKYPHLPLVSIILPTHNRRYLLERSIQSVLDQTYPNWELHIIDDGSTDDTWSYLVSNLPIWKRQMIPIGRYKKSIQIHQTERNGVSSARNLGLEKTEGEWITLLDSDDEWFKEKLEKQIDYHLENPELFFSQTNEIWNKKGNILEPKGKYKKIPGRFLEQSLELCMVTCSSFIAHKQTLSQIGFFRPEMKTCEDYDLWNRILLSGFNIGLLEENLLIRFGGHDDQLSMQYKAIERFRLYSLLSIRNEMIFASGDGNQKKVENGIPMVTNQMDQILLRKAILNRLDTLFQGRLKRGKEIQFLTHIQTQVLENLKIPKKELLTLLDDSLF
ncbi:glycosyltransferase family 2 protein [Leptospira jelokensis]|uniref:Glycosyltransferase family 2 protein n=1 Tax=Leptospira jelokensis TaxID=2484931 RepID=A0A4Z0ZVV7_9LEPT|nr:glycosyltransferase family A protein [Leptospira jelokensis]TGL74038.1 glycosyltransferase family 2 protein [Leptospira jelokensis]